MIIEYFYESHRAYHLISKMLCLQLSCEKKKNYLQTTMSRIGTATQCKRPLGKERNKKRQDKNNNESLLDKHTRLINKQ